MINFSVRACSLKLNGLSSDGYRCSKPGNLNVSGLVGATPSDKVVPARTLSPFFQEHKQSPVPRPTFKNIEPQFFN
jgi:hypothetical protein